MKNFIKNYFENLILSIVCIILLVDYILTNNDISFCMFGLFLIFNLILLLLNRNSKN